MTELMSKDELDFSLCHFFIKEDLQSYNNVEYCFAVPLPSKYSIYELIFILPLDNQCWMWWVITIFVSAVIWRIYEGSGAHWNFLFGTFALFVGKFSVIKT